MDKNLCIADLVNMIEKAIEVGDWKVDGACDPSLLISRAEYILSKDGITRNSREYTWFYEV